MNPDEHQAFACMKKGESWDNMPITPSIVKVVSDAFKRLDNLKGVSCLGCYITVIDMIP